MKFVSIIAVSLFVVLMFGCHKEGFITSENAQLNISTDTIKFDTVFTTAGSVTHSFKIRNDNNQRLRISEIRLMGGSASSFRLNINGNSAFSESNIDIAENDSIYVFVSVYVDPTVATSAFLISDSILVSFNNNQRFVQLEAFGQNAHYIRDLVIRNDTTWTSDLPFVILGSLMVDTAIVLTIEEGCRIYVHANAPILIDGSLVVNGTKSNEVIFTGDRLDPAYRNLPASWPGIYFRPASVNNRLRSAILRNSGRAVSVEGLSPNANTKVELNQCIIDNAFEAGIYCYNGSLSVTNTLITNCGNNVFIEAGGLYDFTNCTVAGYSGNYLIHSNPCMQITNAAFENGTVLTNSLTGNFINCIFWGDEGSVSDEIVTQKEGTDPFSLRFENCLYRAANDPADANLVSVIINEDPSFDSIDVRNNYYDFHVIKNPDAPGINSGTNVALPSDLDDLPRSVGVTDMGCYEKQ